MQTARAVEPSGADGEATGRVVYQDVRDQMQDGDVLLFRGTTFISRMIRRAEGGVYSHAGMVAWWDDRLFVLEAVGHGIRVVPTSLAVDQYAGRVDWFTTPADDAQRKQLLYEGQKQLGKPYDYGGVLRYFARKVLRLSLASTPPGEQPAAMFCSEYVAWCYRQVGLPLLGNATPIDLTSPQDLAGSSVLTFCGTLRP